jgi:DNA topoisomerase-1
MEGELDTIAEREQTYEKVMNDFYLPFKAVLDQADERLSEEMPKFNCPNCNSDKVELKQGWFGFYLDCSNCGKKTSVKSIGKPEPEKLGEICPDCKEGELLIRSSRFGKFIGCSRYPACKYTRQLPTGIKCPKCTIGDIVQRKGGKAKRTFYGCSRYPDCDFISNEKPVNQNCPNCNNNWLATKWSRTSGNFLKCPNCKKEYTPELMEISERAEAA